MCANKLFYLAVPPENYELIFRNLASSGLTMECSDLCEALAERSGCRAAREDRDRR